MMEFTVQTRGVGLEKSESPDARTLELENMVQELEDQLASHDADARNVVAQWEEGYNALVSQLEVAVLEKEELSVDFQTIDDSFGVVGQPHARVAVDSQDEMADNQDQDIIKELATTANSASLLLRERHEGQVRDLVEQLRDQEKWRERYVAAETQLKAAIDEKEMVLSQLKQTRENLELAQTRSIPGDKLMEQELTVENLKKQLFEQEEDANNIVMQWQQSYEDVKAQLEATVVELQDSQDARTKMKGQLDGAKSSVWTSVGVEECVSPDIGTMQLESMVLELQDQLANHDEDARNVVAQWEQGYNDVVSHLEVALTENEELLSELQRKQHDEAALDSQHDEGGNNELQVRIEELALLLDRSQHERHALARKVETMESEIIALRSHADKLQQKVAEMPDPAQRQMQSKISTLESRICEHLETIYRLECELEKEKGHVSILEQKIVDSNEGFNFQLEFSRWESAQTKEELKAEGLRNRETIERLERGIDTLELEKTLLKKERDDLNVRLALMDDELLEANDALQLRLTDQVSEKANDLAATVLRGQINSMHSQAHEDQRAIAELRQSREAAEMEAGKLRADLGALLGMADNEDNRSAIEQRMMEAAESFQRTERVEIESIKKSLSRALTELAAAREAEKKVEERAAKASHQATLYEQEVVNAKSDFKFLTQTMDEMRESESTKRASLEYRISSLENEQNVLKRYHSAEMDHLRNELSHANMERDRLFQALKESEKNKEVLLHASSRDLTTEGDSDPFAELARLRIEKVQLLSAAAEEASRIERRLRETRAAAKASADAEIIVERELRVSAEKSLNTVKLELEDLRSDISQGNVEGAPDKSDLDALREELARCKKENETLSEECTLLREQLDKLNKLSRVNIEQLTEECRQAKARASYLERNGRYEAEVCVEVARLQASYNNGIERAVLVNGNPAVDDDDLKDSFAVAKLYDIVQTQRKAIEEERSVYFELLAEHDDLLAVLAQQDILKLSLEGALTRHCGPEAVDAATTEAEAKAKALYGKYVKLTT